MNPRRILNATFWAAIAIQTIGSIDVGPNAKEPKRKMPSPRDYVAITLVWLVLGWVAQVSDNLARAAATLSGLVLVTTLFVNVAQPGRFTVAGTRLMNFFNNISSQFGTQPPTTSGTSQPPEGSLV